MKPFEALTDAELDALTEEQITRYIDYACAEAGVPLLPVAAPVKPEAVVTRPSVVHHVIGGWRFLDQADGNAVRACVLACRSRRDTASHPPPYRYPTVDFDTPADPSEDIAIRSERVFTADEAMVREQEIAKMKVPDATYEAAKKHWDKVVTARATHERDIRDAIADATARLRQIVTLRASYDRYLGLANGDHDIAARFLLLAYPKARDVVPDLVQSVTDPVLERMDPESGPARVMDEF